MQFHIPRRRHCASAFLKTSFGCATVAAIAALLVFSSAAQAAEKATQKPVFHAAGENLVAKILDNAKPSDAHNIAVLNPLQGDWDYMAKFWTDGKTEPYETSGTQTNTMILDNRFLSETIEGTLNIGGHPLNIRGEGLIGYNNSRKSYGSTWVDTMTTGMMTGTATYDEKEKAIKETGRFTDPLDGVEKDFRAVTKLVDERHYTRTIYVRDRGNEQKRMEFSFTRQH